ncbi:MAG: disulfide bond formation protein B [Rhodobacteraceae bacterium]|nr:disulfide bond formation protein B [Paracoccaceae bacterium]MCF8514446.1 disulfide bond formation protein B [Paracoccaceae bacterium]MCF8518690.1 disulfide bond formation protein B [Paracoccaceae bacterium]
MLTRNQLVAAAGLGSLALLAGAFGFQYIGGLAPCQLCLWQRWPHAAAIVIMLAALVLSGRILPVLGILAALATAGVGMFHVGVEQMWWEGLASCSGNSIAGLNVSDLLNPNVAIAAPIRCDAIAWSLFGISMAGWNVIVSLGLAVLWLMAARKPA